MEVRDTIIIQCLGLRSGSNQVKQLIDAGILIVTNSTINAKERKFDLVASIRNYINQVESSTENLEDKLKQTQIRKNLNEIKVKELKFQALNREIVLKSSVDRIFGNEIHNAKQSLVMMGSKMAPQLTNENDPNKIKAKIDDEVFKVLRNLAAGAKINLVSPDVQKILRELDKQND